jgi:hypothetical protein
MQSFSLPHAPPEVYVLIGTLLGLIPQFITAYRNWKKSDKEEDEAQARAELARVSAQSLEVRDRIATGEGVSKMLSTMIEANDTIRELQVKVFDLEQRALELKMARYEIRKMKGLLDAHSIPYSEADKSKTKSQG